MAELVFLRLEHGLQELEEMERIKLFSKDEIKKIAKKRKMFEYRLRRRLRNKEDFLQYIEFEICLLLLISKRRQRLLVESKKKEIDNSIAKKVNRLFKAVISRYPEDEKLWLNQIEYFKRMKWNDSINALYSKILQVHSRKPDIWIMAAKWQMEENNSFENARKLFQRAVLVNPKSEILWREYFKMEMKYLEMIKKRKEILQSQNMKAISKEQDTVTNGKVVEAVYENAIEEIPDVEFALSFLTICFEFDFAVKLGDFIIYNIRKKFPDKEESLDALSKVPLLHLKERTERWARRGVSAKNVNKQIFNEICGRYEESVKVFSTEKMWKYYLDFLFLKLENCKTEKSQLKVEHTIITKMDEAACANCLPVEFYIQRSKLLLKHGQTSKGLEVSLSAAHEWKTVPLWLECLLLHIQSRKSKESIYALFKEAMSSLNEKDCLQIWKLGIDWLTMTDPGKLIEFFEEGITKVKEVSLPLKEMYLETIALRDGVKAARKLYNRFKTMGPLSSILHQKMIKIERAQVEPSLTHIRACYEDMVKEYGHSNVDVWLEFMHFEAEYARNPESFNMLQWRGKKTLQPQLVDEFQTRITSLLTGGRTFTDKDFDALH